MYILIYVIKQLNLTPHSSSCASFGYVCMYIYILLHTTDQVGRGVTIDEFNLKVVMIDDINLVEGKGIGHMEAALRLVSYIPLLCHPSPKRSRHRSSNFCNEKTNAGWLP